MTTNFEKIAHTNSTDELLKDIFNENDWLVDIIKKSENPYVFNSNLKEYFDNILKNKPNAVNYLDKPSPIHYNLLKSDDVAIIRCLDYLRNSGEKYEDQNLQGDLVVNDPFRWIWEAYNKVPNPAKEDYFYDMRELFRRLNNGGDIVNVSKEDVLKWMDKHHSGLDNEIVEIRKRSKKRIIDTFIKKMDKGEISDRKYKFEENQTYQEKFEAMNKWWNDRSFHLKFALRDPDLINDFLDNSLSEETMKTLYDAKEKGIPFFVNPYYLSLLIVNEDKKYRHEDNAIRDYIFYSAQLVDEYGDIVAWEKEDIVEPGKPNAAGWLLPSHHSIHRRYPKVAIFIPDTVGRSCGGLCVSCQRMYDFQSGHLNFDLEKLKPNESWGEKLKRLLKYFEEDSQLRDILVTGGDALMSSNRSLRKILDEIYNVALRKKEANKNKAEGEKYAELLRVRLGSRLPVYIPQRADDELIEILSEFKEKASKIGIKQFVIQTHFVSPMEVTPEAAEGVAKLTKAGWMVTNQQVFTAAASLRGKTALLRKTLNDIGVVTYYTFSVKGFRENSNNFATNARAVQEQQEEKIIGAITKENYDKVREFPVNAENLVELLKEYRQSNDVPFLATDRNVMNLPGVGKSLTYRVTGITPDGRRILEFEHDQTRQHSPAVNEDETVRIIEAKSIGQYLRQIEAMGEDRKDYESIFNYSIGLTEDRMPIYEYPEYDFETTDEFTNIEY